MSGNDAFNLGMLTREFTRLMECAQPDMRLRTIDPGTLRGGDLQIHVVFQHLETKDLRGSLDDFSANVLMPAAVGLAGRVVSSGADESLRPALLPDEDCRDWIGAQGIWVRGLLRQEPDAKTQPTFELRFDVLLGGVKTPIPTQEKAQ